jgi:hypothetical protein
MLLVIDADRPMAIRKTEPQRHKDTKFISKFVSWCLCGSNIRPIVRH